jgi:dienelactone hydrolase
MNFNDVYLILKKCISYAKNKNKAIILMGFSTGAALGLKLLELLDDISLGVFFYGYPSAKNLQPDKIDCPVIIFHSEKDKIKHLSDDQQLQSIT